MQAPRPIIVLAPAADQIERVLQRLSSRGAARMQCQVIGASSGAALAARRFGLPWRNLASYGAIDQHWEEAARLSGTWYRDGGRDFSEHGGLSLAAFGEVDMFLYLARLLDEVGRLEAVLKQEKPAEVWLGAEAPASWERVLPSIEGTIVSGEPIRTARLGGRSSGKDRRLKQWFKEAGLDRHVRALLLALRRPSRTKAGRRRVTAGDDSPRIVTIADIPTPSVIGSLLPVIKALPAEQSLVVVTDPRVPSLLHGTQSPLTWASPIDLLRQSLAYLRARQLFHSRWQDYRGADFGPRHFRIDGIDLWPAVAGHVKALFLRQFPFTFLEASVAALVLRRYRVRAILTASHAHYSGRLYCEVGRRHGIPSLSLQHGVAGVPSVYAPVHSTKMAVWGELPREWLVQNGADPEQLVVTGQPRLDALVKRRAALHRYEVARQLGIELDVPIWTVAPDPEPPDIRAAMTDLIAAMVDHFPGVCVALRHHPDDDEDYYRRRLAVAMREGRVALAARLDLASLLAVSQLVFVGQSTLGLEAMVLGCPLIELNPLATFEFVPYVREGAAPMVRGRADLEPAVSSVLENDRERFEAGRRDFIGKYASGADGQSTRRVVELIQAMARGSA